MSDVDAVRRSVRSIASQSPQVLQHTDTFFVVRAGRLKVREFADGSGELIAYDRPDQSGPKTSIYSIVRCDDGHALAGILSRLVPVRGRVVKRRELWMIGRTRVHLDEVETLGWFVELEVVLGPDEPFESGEREARELMARLGIEEEALVPEAYIDLVVSGHG